MNTEGRESLTGRNIRLPDVNTAPMPLISDPGAIINGTPAAGFAAIDPAVNYPDTTSYRRKFGLLAPATNTTMEHDLWSVIVENRGSKSLAGVGVHTTGVVTPRPQLLTAADVVEYGRQFLNGLGSATETALLAAPEYLILGMSLEHVLCGIDAIRASVDGLDSRAGCSWSVWHDAAPAALNAFGAQRVGLVTPFDAHGNANATRMFIDLGYDVVGAFGFSCGNAMHIAHIPDAAKEAAIRYLLAHADRPLDAIVQCGTNMSVRAVGAQMEPEIGIPVLGINMVLLWHALRETGLNEPVVGGGRLLAEH